ncbi:hypothetical protein HUZ36_07855 [Pseudoalteromonas sp. McH1-7]|uniref:hypothetical protein n=1 Tax=unclassified Pseudoalteromonas TaxID=194690 RepID=UPI0015926B59|nr:MULTISPECIES: hypothetical protein [unclassified Pseudoalteromonas]NUZ10690.1 hypothetical protein [Pseudoalteromonas sp. McH1-7]USD29061.1 hypothetical protein J8Z24_02910 [Pseudoalteromonas sp. SCSIO 43201]
MIIRISLVISLVASSYLLTGLADTTELNNSNTEAKALRFAPSQSLLSATTEAEKKWYALSAAQKVKQERAVAPEKPKPKSQQVLTFDGIEFTLLGIFKNQQDKFVLLSSREGGMLRVSAGESITENVQLKSVATDSMTILVANEERNIRLFKRVNEGNNG